MLPEQILWHTDEAPRGNRIHAQAVSVPCPRCKRVQLLTKDDWVGVHAAWAPSQLETVYLDAILGCVGPGCEFQAPAFAQWTPESSVEERQDDIESWLWDGLLCPQGHAVLNPGYRWKKA